MTKTKEIKLQPLLINRIKVKVKGITPLIQDKIPQEAKDQILAKQTGTSKSNKKKVRRIEEETMDAIHTTSKGIIGFPAEGFKKGMIESTSFVGDKFFSKKLVRGVRIMNAVDGLIPIKFKKQSVLEHFINPNTKFSPMFEDWSCEIEFGFDPNNISAQDILTLVNYAGFYNGIGSWRPNGGGGGSGEYGMYEVAKSR